MNRAKRRKIVNKKQDTMDAVKTALAIQRQQIEKEKKEWQMESIEIILNMVAYTLNYKLSLGKKRLPGIMSSIVDNIDAFHTGHLSKSDYYEIKQIIENLGVKI